MARANPPLAHYAEKGPTALHEGFAAYIEDQTGYKPDLKTVQLATVLRMEYQRSDENKRRRTAAKKAAPAKATRPAAKKTAAKKAPAKKAPAKKAAPKPANRSGAAVF